MVEIASDNDALALVRDEGFRRRWQDLYSNCPWATGFQSPDFVATWYEAYAEQVSPLIVTQIAANDRLTGLFTLATSNGTGQLVVPGGSQAEYQVWLARAEGGERFIEEAMEALRGRFPNQTLTLQYVPPGTPLGWLGKGRPWRSRAVLTETFRPLVPRKDAQELGPSPHKHRYRNKANQLRRIGSLQFARLTDGDSFRVAIDEILAQHDLRRGAAFGQTPFHNDARIKPFYLALMQVPGLLHVTTTTLDGQVIAAHVGVCDANTLHGGMMCHSPIYDRQSAGLLHMYWLAEHVVKHGPDCFDLTPGESPWKTRL
jgi:CelD/BcsL family acetyltransferase involved in cellulose biosynthesis